MLVNVITFSQINIVFRKLFCKSVFSNFRLKHLQSVSLVQFTWKLVSFKNSIPYDLQKSLNIFLWLIRSNKDKIL